MKKSNFVLQVINSKGLPDKHKVQLFKTHKNVFRNKYSRFPIDFDAFEKKLNDQKVCSILLLLEEKIVGFKIFKFINKYQVQTYSMAVDSEFRGLRLSNLINAVACEYLKWNGYKYITSWSHVDNNISALLSKYATLVSTDDTLNKLELKMLNNFEKSIGLKKGFYGTKRRVVGFYKMLNNSCGDAYFWVHKL